MSSGARRDPYRNFRFQVEINGIIQAGFSDAKIPDSTNDVIEYREGNESPYLRKPPSVSKFGVLTLKRGVTDSIEFYEWRKLVERGKMNDARKNIAVILLDKEGNQVSRWEFEDAWPSKLDPLNVTTKGTDMTIENLEISFKRCRKRSTLLRNIMAFHTEFEFTLPKGYIDEDGSLHKKGTMRLATAADEILPLKDPRVQQNPAYLTIILLSRVITKLGELTDVNPRIVESLFASDLSYLKEFYNDINEERNIDLKVKCPHCSKTFNITSSNQQRD